MQGVVELLSAQLDRLAGAGVRIPTSHIGAHDVDVSAEVMDRLETDIGSVSGG